MLKPFRSFLFVCTGNTCRSPMAEYLFRSFEDMSYRVASAGTHAYSGSLMSENAVKALVSTKNFVRDDLLKHRSRLLSVDLLKEFDCVLTMEKSHKLFIEQLSPEYSSSVFLLPSFLPKPLDGISDPIVSSLEVYCSVMEQIKTSLIGLRKVLCK